jgi:hypothetical protein
MKLGIQCPLLGVKRTSQIRARLEFFPARFAEVAKNVDGTLVELGGNLNR